MQWTTGDASGGTGGFGGTPAVVGANLGNGTSFIQIGTFDHAGTNYDGPFGTNDGVSWLDYRSFVFSTEVPNSNIPPLVSGNVLCDTISLCAGTSTTLDVTFFSPEPAQTTSPNATAPTLGPSFSITSVSSGVTATISVAVAPTEADTGYHVLTFYGTDTGTPSQTTIVSVIIQVLPAPILPPGTLSLCANGDAVPLENGLSSPLPQGGLWYAPQGTQHGPLFDPFADPIGTYTYVAPMPGGCAAYGPVDVVTYDLDDDSIVTNVLCHGGDGQIQVLTNGPIAPWNYTWTDAGGTVVRSTIAANGDTFTGPVGTYTVVVMEGPGGLNCTDTLTATITEPDTLLWIAVPNDTLICLTGHAVLSAIAQGGTGTIQLHWTPGLVGDGPHTVSPPGTTLYTVQAEDANGCLTSVDSALVSVNPPLSFIPLEPDTECFNVPLTFTAAGTAGGNGQYFYDWGNGPDTSNTTTFIMPVSGTVCVTLSDGCETPWVTSCVPVEILQTPPLVLTADTVLGCAPFTVRFNLQDTTEQASVLWDFGFGLPEADSTSVVHLFPVAGNFSIGAVVTWPNGCITDTTISTMVRVITVPIADIFWSPNPASILEPTVHFQDLSQPNVVSWQWDFGEYGTSSEQDPVITFPNEVGGSYPLQLVVSNELGCTDTIRSIVDVLDDFLVFVPNAFSPNAEGPNETFFVSGNDISTEEYQLIVFDRWGQELFNSTNRFEEWDGTAGGEVLPQGVYVWKLKVRALSSTQKRTLYGHVTLLR